MEWLHIMTKTGRRSFMWLFGIMIILVTMVTPVLAFANSPEVQKASTAYIQAKNNYLHVKERLLSLEKEIKALDTLPSSEIIDKTPAIAGESSEVRLVMPKDFRSHYEKRSQLIEQYRSTYETLNSADRVVYEAMYALQEAVRFSQPPILTAVSYHSEKKGEMYKAVWESTIPDALGQKIAEQKELLNKIETRIQERFTARKPLIVQQKKYSDAYNKHVGNWTFNNVTGIVSTSLSEATGMIAGAFIGDPATAVNLATTVGSAIAKYMVSEDPDYDFVRDLQKYRKEGGLNKEEGLGTLKSILAGDALEEIINHPLEMTITCFAKSFGQVDTKVMNELVSDAAGKGYAKSLGVGVATSLVKGMVGEYFQQEADMAKKNAFEAYIGHELFQQIINKSIQGDAPFVQARQQIRRNILELNQQTKCANSVWSKNVSVSKPFRSLDIKNDIRVSLTFSAPLLNTPKVRLHSFNVVVKPVGDLPTTRFDGHVTVPAPKEDGTYEYSLNVRVSPPDRLDGNPETIPTYDPEKSIWRQVEPFDKEHTMRLISFDKLIKELEGYEKEISDYISFMNKRLEYGDAARQLIRSNLISAGVNVNEYIEIMRIGTWYESVSRPWLMHDSSARHYLLAHWAALEDSVDALSSVTSVSNEEILQFRSGMKELRNYMKITKKALLECWMNNTIEEAKFLESADDLTRQYYAIPFDIYEDVINGPRAKINEKKTGVLKKGDEANLAAFACLKPVRKDPKAPHAFVSLNNLRKEKNK
jgi:hypothetical protein